MGIPVPPPPSLPPSHLIHSQEIKLFMPLAALKIKKKFLSLFFHRIRLMSFQGSVKVTNVGYLFIHIRCSLNQEEESMKMSRTIAALLAVLSLGLSACVNSPADSGTKGIYTPGSYTSSGKGYGGMVDVTVTVDGKKITAVKGVGDKETKG